MKDKYFVSDKLCSECKGKCCKQFPGISLPEEFGKNKEEIFENLKIVFSSGKWAVDWWDDLEINDGVEIKKAYFVRPKVKGISGIYDPSWGGECIFLTEKGCELNIDKRPSGCKLVEPKKGVCKYHGLSKEEFAIAWLKYCNIIEEAVKIVEEKNE